jgi:hypothetical protein
LLLGAEGAVEQIELAIGLFAGVDGFDFLRLDVGGGFVRASNKMSL